MLTCSNLQVIGYHPGCYGWGGTVYPGCGHLGSIGWGWGWPCGGYCGGCGPCSCKDNTPRPQKSKDVTTTAPAQIENAQEDNYQVFAISH